MPTYYDKETGKNVATLGNYTEADALLEYANKSDAFDFNTYKQMMLSDYDSAQTYLKMAAIHGFGGTEKDPLPTGRQFNKEIFDAFDKYDDKIAYYYNTLIELDEDLYKSNDAVIQAAYQERLKQIEYDNLRPIQKQWNTFLARQADVWGQIAGWFGDVALTALEFFEAWGAATNDPRAYKDSFKHQEQSMVHPFDGTVQEIVHESVEDLDVYKMSKLRTKFGDLTYTYDEAADKWIAEYFEGGVQSEKAAKFRDYEIGIGQGLSQLLIGQIPVVGQALYWGSMAAGVVANVSYSKQYEGLSESQRTQLLIENLAIELGTEVIIGGGASKIGIINPKRFYRAAAGIERDGLRKAVTGTAKVIFEGMGEGLEEVAAEYLETGFDAVIISDNSVYDFLALDKGGVFNPANWNKEFGEKYGWETASGQNVLMAGLVGGIVGMFGAGANLFKSRNTSIHINTKKGVREIKGLDAVLFEEARVIKTLEQLSKQTMVEKSAALNGVSVETFSTDYKYKQQYQDAVKVDEKRWKANVRSLGVLSSIANVVGDDNLKKMIAGGTQNVQQRFEEVRNYFRNQEINTARVTEDSKLIAEYNEFNEGKSNLSVVTDETEEMRMLRQTVPAYDYRVNRVVFVSQGKVTAEDGFDGFFIYKGTMFVDERYARRADLLKKIYNEIDSDVLSARLLKSLKSNKNDAWRDIKKTLKKLGMTSSDDNINAALLFDPRTIHFLSNIAPKRAGEVANAIWREIMVAQRAKNFEHMIECKKKLYEAFVSYLSEIQQIHNENGTKFADSMNDRTKQHNLSIRENLAEWYSYSGGSVKLEGDISTNEFFTIAERYKSAIEDVYRKDVCAFLDSEENLSDEEGSILKDYNDISRYSQRFLDSLDAFIDNGGKGRITVVPGEYEKGIPMNEQWGVDRTVRIHSDASFESKLNCMLTEQYSCSIKVEGAVDKMSQVQVNEYVTPEFSALRLNFASPESKQKATEAIKEAREKLSPEIRAKRSLYDRFGTMEMPTISQMCNEIHDMYNSSAEVRSLIYDLTEGVTISENDERVTLIAEQLAEKLSGLTPTNRMVIQWLSAYINDTVSYKSGNNTINVSIDSQYLNRRIPKLIDDKLDINNRVYSKVDGMSVDTYVKSVTEQTQSSSVVEIDTTNIVNETGKKIVDEIDKTSGAKIITVAYTGNPVTRTQLGVQTHEAFDLTAKEIKLLKDAYNRGDTAGVDALLEALYGTSARGIAESMESDKPIETVTNDVKRIILENIINGNITEDTYNLVFACVDVNPTSSVVEESDMVETLFHEYQHAVQNASFNFNINGMGSATVISNRINSVKLLIEGNTDKMNDFNSFCKQLSLAVNEIIDKGLYANLDQFAGKLDNEGYNLQNDNKLLGKVLYNLSYVERMSYDRANGEMRHWDVVGKEYNGKYYARGEIMNKYKVGAYLGWLNDTQLPPEHIMDANPVITKSTDDSVATRNADAEIAANMSEDVKAKCRSLLEVLSALTDGTEVSDAEMLSVFKNPDSIKIFLRLNPTLINEFVNAIGEYSTKIQEAEHVSDSHIRSLNEVEKIIKNICKELSAMYVEQNTLYAGTSFEVIYQEYLQTGELAENWFNVLATTSMKNYIEHFVYSTMNAKRINTRAAFTDIDSYSEQGYNEIMSYVTREEVASLSEQEAFNLALSRYVRIRFNCALNSNATEIHPLQTVIAMTKGGKAQGYRVPMTIYKMSKLLARQTINKAMGNEIHSAVFTMKDIVSPEFFIASGMNSDNHAGILVPAEEGSNARMSQHGTISQDMADSSDEEIAYYLVSKFKSIGRADSDQVMELIGMMRKTWARGEDYSLLVIDMPVNFNTVDDVKMYEFFVGTVMDHEFGHAIEKHFGIDSGSNPYAVYEMVKQLNDITVDEMERFDEQIKKLIKRLDDLNVTDKLKTVPSFRWSLLRDENINFGDINLRNDYISAVSDLLYSLSFGELNLTLHGQVENIPYWHAVQTKDGMLMSFDNMAPLPFLNNAVQIKEEEQYGAFAVSDSGYLNKGHKNKEALSNDVAFLLAKSGIIPDRSHVESWNKLEALGFSEDFNSLYLSHNLGKQEVIDLLRTNRVGNDEATRKVISILFPDSRILNTEGTVWNRIEEICNLAPFLVSVDPKRGNHITAAFAKSSDGKDKHIIVNHEYTTTEEVFKEAMDPRDGTLDIERSIAMVRGTRKETISQGDVKRLTIVPTDASIFIIKNMRGILTPENAVDLVLQNVNGWAKYNRETALEGSTEYKGETVEGNLADLNGKTDEDVFDVFNRLSDLKEKYPELSAETDKAELRVKQKQQAELRKKLESTTDEAERKSLEEKIKEYDDKISRLKTEIERKESALEDAANYERDTVFSQLANKYKDDPELFTEDLRKHVKDWSDHEKMTKLNELSHDYGKLIKEYLGLTNYRNLTSILGGQARSEKQTISKIRKELDSMGVSYDDLPQPSNGKKELQDSEHYGNHSTFDEISNFLKLYQKRLQDAQDEFAGKLPKGTVPKQNLRKGFSRVKQYTLDFEAIRNDLLHNGLDGFDSSQISLLNGHIAEIKQKAGMSAWSNDNITITKEQMDAFVKENPQYGKYVKEYGYKVVDNSVGEKETSVDLPSSDKVDLAEEQKALAKAERKLINADKTDTQHVENIKNEISIRKAKIEGLQENIKNDTPSVKVKPAPKTGFKRITPVQDVATTKLSEQRGTTREVDDSDLKKAIEREQTAGQEALDRIKEQSNIDPEEQKRRSEQLAKSALDVEVTVEARKQRTAEKMKEKVTGKKTGTKKVAVTKTNVKTATIETAKTEPVKTETVKTETAKTETVKTEPVKTETVKTEPVKTETTETKTEKKKTVNEVIDHITPTQKQKSLKKVKSTTEFFDRVRKFVSRPGPELQGDQIKKEFSKDIQEVISMNDKDAATFIIDFANMIITGSDPKSAIRTLGGDEPFSLFVVLSTMANTHHFMEPQYREAVRRKVNAAKNVIDHYAAKTMAATRWYDMLTTTFIDQIQAESKEDGIVIDKELIDGYEKAQVARDYKNMKKYGDAILKDYAKKLPKVFQLLKNPNYENVRTAALYATMKLNSYRYWSLLSRPSTHVKNIVSNVELKLLDSIADKLDRFFESKIAKATGSPTVDQFSWVARTKSTSTARDYVKKTFVDNGLIDFILEGSKYSPSEDQRMAVRALGEHPATHAITEKLHDLVFANMEKEDLWFVKPRAIQLAERIVTNLEASGVNIYEMDGPTKHKILNTAIGEAQRSYLRNNNALTRWIQGIGVDHPFMKMAFSLLLPFARVSANVTTKLWEYSPFGAISVVKDIMAQKARNREQLTKEDAIISDAFAISRTTTKASRALIGSVLWSLGFALGFIPDLFKYDEEAYGMTIKMGNVSFSLDMLTPALSAFLLGASMSSEPGDRTKLANFADTFYNITMFSDLSQIAGWFGRDYSESFDETLENIATGFGGDLATQMIPSVIKAFTKIIDPTIKNYTGMTPKQKMIYKLAANIPGLSLVTPAKVDPYTGENQEMYSGRGQAIGRLFLPFNWYGDDKYALQIEAERLAEKFPDKSGLTASTLSTEIEINGLKYQLNKSQLHEYASLRGNLIATIGNNIINSEEYVNATDEERITMMRSVYTDAQKYTRIIYWSNEQDGTYLASKEEYNKLVEYVGDKANYRIRIANDKKYKDASGTQLKFVVEE